MSKWWKIPVGVAGVLAVASYASGITPAYVSNAPAMVTGMGAMVACSAKYVSGIGAEQNLSDLGSYSPLLAELDITYDDSEKRVSAEFLGLDITSASYRNGLGCALDIGDTSTLDGLTVPNFENEPNALWPMGNKTLAPDAKVQAVLESLIVKDNTAGLQTRAYLVVKDGQVIAETYAEGFGAKSKLFGWSMTKSMNAIMVGNMEMRGLIDPAHKPVFGNWARDERKEISLDDMLHMASGLDLAETYQPGETVTRLLFTENSGSALGLDVPLVAEPGTRYQYSSGTSNLLSRLVFEKNGGAQANLDYLYGTFLKPMGMRDTLFETDPQGVLMGGSFMLSSARDWARVGQLMLNGGELNGHRIVTEAWVKRALTPNHTENNKGYGYQFWLNYGNEEARWPDLPADTYAMLGSRDQMVMMFPSENTIIVRLGWNADNAYPKNEQMRQILDAAS